MKIWKRNAVLATVLLFICAGVYLNWSYNQKQKPQDLTDTLNAEQVMGDTTLQMEDAAEPVSLDVGNTSAEDYFAQVRLSRQASRDSAVNLLEETIAYDEGTAVGDTASQTLNRIVGTALSEAQIESLIIAKGFTDCVTYIADDTISVAVSAPAEGLSTADVALIKPPNGKHMESITLPSQTTASPPCRRATSLTATAISLSLTPTVTMLWWSWLMEYASAPFFSVKPCTKPTPTLHVFTDLIPAHPREAYGKTMQRTCAQPSKKERAVISSTGSFAV